MWTKKSDHAPKSECADFFKYMPKKGTFERKINKVCPFSSLHLGSTGLHFLLNVSKMWPANLLTTILTNK